MEAVVKIEAQWHGIKKKPDAVFVFSCCIQRLGNGKARLFWNYGQRNGRREEGWGKPDEFSYIEKEFMAIIQQRGKEGYKKDIALPWNHFIDFATTIEIPSAVSEKHQDPSHTSLLFGRYHLLELLGSGTYGKVWYAEDAYAYNRPVAVKQFTLDTVAQQEQEDHLSSFYQESEIQARLSHAGLPYLLEAGYEESEHTAYIVMEYIPGHTLFHVLQQAQDHRLSHEEVRSLAEQLGSVLSYLHRQSQPIIFRDLKPQNIIMAPENRVRVIDLGIARFYQPEKTRDTMMLGSPGYAAPEQYGKGQSDPRTDIYSFAVVLYQALTGYDPVTHMGACPFGLPPLPELFGYHPNLSTVFAKASALAPAQRYQSIEEFLSHFFAAYKLLPQKKMSREEISTLPTSRIAQSKKAPLPEETPQLSLKKESILIVAHQKNQQLVTEMLQRTQQDHGIYDHYMINTFLLGDKTRRQSMVEKMKDPQLILYFLTPDIEPIMNKIAPEIQNTRKAHFYYDEPIALLAEPPTTEEFIPVNPIPFPNSWLKNGDAEWWWNMVMKTSIPLRIHALQDHQEEKKKKNRQQQKIS